MVKGITEAPYETDIIITINCSLFESPLKVWVSTEDTIAILKEFIGENYELFSDEMTIIMGSSHPYPLADEMRLSRLFVEHRHLTLFIHEGKEICYGASYDMTEDRVWTHPIPERYIGLIESRVILDFRYLSPSSLFFIRPWLYQIRTVSEIWLLGTHPNIMNMLYAISEDVLSLIGLKAIIIQNPASPRYIIPNKSANRHSVGPSHLQINGLSYLYQHLLLDRYRPSAEEVEIWVDGSLLPDRCVSFRYTGEITDTITT